MEPRLGINSKEASEEDYVVPDTPEYEENTTGDLGYTPYEAEENGIEQLPIRCTVGVGRKINEELKKKYNESIKMEAEIFIRNVANTAGSFNAIYLDNDKIIFSSNLFTKAILTHKTFDEEAGELFYSVQELISLKDIPSSARLVWQEKASMDEKNNLSLGELVWVDMGNLDPDDRKMKPKVTDPHEPPPKSLRNKTSKFYLSSETKKPKIE